MKKAAVSVEEIVTDCLCNILTSTLKFWFQPSLLWLFGLQIYITVYINSHFYIPVFLYVFKFVVANVLMFIFAF